MAGERRKISAIAVINSEKSLEEIMVFISIRGGKER